MVEERIVQSAGLCSELKVMFNLGRMLVDAKTNENGWK